MKIVTKATATVTPVTDEQSSTPDGRVYGEFDVILSTKSLDRDGDELRPDEWLTPLPDHITFDSDHGMSVVTTVGSGRPFINGDGQLQVRGTFASTSHAQNVRTLVNEGHIRNVSVAFANHKPTKDAAPRRELLNGAFVAIPANPQAVVLSSKAAKPDADEMSAFADPGYRDDELRRYPVNSPENVLHSALDFAIESSLYDDGQADEIRDRIRAAAVALGVTKGITATVLDRKIFETASGEPEDLDMKAASAGHADVAQSLHDVSVNLGATCPAVAVAADPGITDGANKSATKTSRRGEPKSTDDPAAAAQAAAAGESADEAQKALIAQARALTRKLAKRAG